jgi:hypothetical protein
MKNRKNTTCYCLWYLYWRLNINKTLRRKKQVLIIVIHLNAHTFHGSNVPPPDQHGLSVMKISALFLSTASQYRAMVIPPLSLFIPSTNLVYLILEELNIYGILLWNVDTKLVCFNCLTRMHPIVFRCSMVYHTSRRSLLHADYRHCSPLQIKWQRRTFTNPKFKDKVLIVWGNDKVKRGEYENKTISRLNTGLIF